MHFWGGAGGSDGGNGGGNGGDGGPRCPRCQQLGRRKNVALSSSGEVLAVLPCSEAFRCVVIAHRAIAGRPIVRTDVAAHNHRRALGTRVGTGGFVTCHIGIPRFASGRALYLGHAAIEAAMSWHSACSSAIATTPGAHRGNCGDTAHIHSVQECARAGVRRDAPEASKTTRMSITATEND